MFALFYRINLNQRDDAVNMGDIMTERNGFPSVSERISGQYFQGPVVQEDGGGSFGSEGNMPNIL